MMYKLTLTQQERAAFDFVGDRYNQGEMAKILRANLPYNTEWNQEEDIEFTIPEADAWKIMDLAIKNAEGRHGMFPLFDNDLKYKMHQFLSRIV